MRQRAPRIQSIGLLLWIFGLVLSAGSVSVDAGTETGLGLDRRTWLEDGRPALERLEPRLRGLAESEDQDRVLDLIVMADRRLDLGLLDPLARQFAWPAGEEMALLRLPVRDLLRLAALEGVVEVWAGLPEALPSPSILMSTDAEDAQAAWSTGRASPGQPIGWDLQETERGETPASAGVPSRQEALPETAGDNNSPFPQVPLADSPFPQVPLAVSPSSQFPHADSPLADSPPQASDWQAIHGSHAAGEAWDLGYRGEGLRVGLIDDAVDFAHPDMQGSWAVLPEGHPQAGWPQVFDPVSAYLQSSDNRTPPESRASRTARTGRIELYQTSAVALREVAGEMRPTACLRALEWLNNAQTLLEASCDFIVPDRSKGGVVRFGHHPDSYLRSALADRDNGITGRAPGVLLVDEAEAGVYDTVYVDLDGDRDFSDEKPANRQSPAIWRDMDGDGIADRSGGLLYYLSDGVAPFPGSWLFGMQEEIPPAGEVIGLHYATGINGTAPGSAIASRGRLGLPEGFDLSFRDLPGDGRPSRTNLGVAPGAGLVSIGPLNYGRVAYEAGWRYALYGHDPSRPDDDLQVAAYPMSGTFLEHDGWDYENRLLDHYLRDPQAGGTALVFGTGDGGPGYGSNTGAMPALGISVASGTHLGATGLDSINSTGQIATGDVIPFSGRGPGTEGRGGPHLAADGAYAAGAISLNVLASQGRSGALANQTWGGPRRAAAVAAGATALVYQAFRDREGRWPSPLEARAILMAGARPSGYDIFTGGAGSLDTGDAVGIAAGRQGLYAEPALWLAGAEAQPGYAPLVSRGQLLGQTIRILNPSPETVEVKVSARRPRRIGHAEDGLITENARESREPLVPDYLLPIDRALVPEGTELMVVHGTSAQAGFDPTGDNRPDNHFSLGVIQHSDLDGDGLLWDDANANGAVNSLPSSPFYVTADWDGLEQQFRALEATFTPALDETGVAGELAHYGLACDDAGGLPEPPAEALTGRIALIERGVCSFYQKLGNAIELGAIAAVVYSDDRDATAMGSEEGNLDIPAVMIDRENGLAMLAARQAGKAVGLRMQKRGATVPWGLDGGRRVSYADSEIEGREFVRLNYDSTPRHHWSVPVHHPLERWSDGLYTALWHSRQTASVTTTQISLRYDYYAWRDWPGLDAGAASLQIPAGGEVELQLRLQIPEDAPYGALQAAVMLDYARQAGETRLEGPGGFEPEGHRLTIPVVAQVAADLDASSALHFGGEAARDPDALPDPGAVQGLWGWGQRTEQIDRGAGPESGDWRFYFFRAEPPARGTRWLAFTRWLDPEGGRSDVDSRFYGPAADAFTSGATRGEDGRPLADPAWYGPAGMGIVARSADTRVYYTGKPFNTSTGYNEDWFVLPGGRGLHELALQTVRFSGSQVDMPVEAAIGSIRVEPEQLRLMGEACAAITVTSQLPLPNFAADAFGVTPTRMLRGIPASQDDPDRSTASFRHDIRLEEPASFFELRLAHDPGNNLDMILLYDANQDGVFNYSSEVLKQNYGGLAVELIALDGTQPAGHYQVWVYGQRVATPGVTFDLLIDVVSGKSISLQGLPQGLQAGVPASFRACVDASTARRITGQARGMVTFGPGTMPWLLDVPVAWESGPPIPIYLPRLARP